MSVSLAEEEAASSTEAGAPVPEIERPEKPRMVSSMTVREPERVVSSAEAVLEI